MLGKGGGHTGLGGGNYCPRKPNSSTVGGSAERCTRNFLTFANTTAIAYRQNLEAPGNFRPYAIAVVFANVRKLQVREDQS